MSTPATQPVKTKSKAYSSTVAIQGDAAKYRQKYKELKRKTREIEAENDKLHLKTLRIKRNIQRMRLERAILYERLESETQDSLGGFGSVQPYESAAGRDMRSNDPYATMADPASIPGRGDHASYHPLPSRQRLADPRASDVRPQSSVTVPSYDRKERMVYGYDRDYPPPGPQQAHPHAYHPHDARPHSPTAAPSSNGDRAERLRQYTPSASPEPRAAADTDHSLRSTHNIAPHRGA